jgi:twitching motility protein PilU
MPHWEPAVNTTATTIDFTSFLKLMAHQRASDLFITAGMPPAIKVNGKISPITQTPLTPQQSRDLVLNVMTPAQREEFEKTHECNFAIGLSGVGRFRVSCFYQRNQVGMVLRRIETRIPTVEELSLPPIIKTLAMTKRGIILFVGATGTGKSTSLAAMIGYRNQNSTGHIITIEDPIEFVHKHEGCIITQREVGIDTDSWEAALKNTLRQAPDVIMIGEVRTREGMDHAIAFAETGHLVLCTLHANNANQAMDRIVNFFPEDRRNQLLMDLSLNLKGVVAQQLIPSPDGRSRKVAMEILLGTPLVQDYIRDGEIHKLKELMKESVQLGMKTFDQSLFELYRPVRSATRTHCATPIRRTKCACASSSARAAMPAPCRRGWMAWRFQRSGNEGAAAGGSAMDGRTAFMRSSHDRLPSRPFNPLPLQAYRHRSPTGARRCRHVNSAAAA